MNEADFVARREPSWQRLHALCGEAESSPKNLEGDKLREFVQLYRAVGSDLSTVRTQSGNWQLSGYLNSLVGRSYSVLYRNPRIRFREALARIVATGAQSIRRQWMYVAASALVILMSAFFASAMLDTRPDLRDHFVSENEEDLFAHWREGKFTERTGDQNSMMWSFYASNNPRVAIMTGAIGASTFGVGTLLMNVRLGVQVGALTHDMATVGKQGFFLASIMPHGASELTGAVVSGAAGLLMGMTFLFPGRRSRTQAMQVASRDAFALFVQGVLMMYIAAPFEAFFSFNPTFPTWLKAVVGTLVLTTWISYWRFYARTPEES